MLVIFIVFYNTYISSKTIIIIVFFRYSMLIMVIHSILDCQTIRYGHDLLKGWIKNYYYYNLL